MILGAFVFALFTPFVFDALLTHLFVKAVAVALFTPRVTLATDGLTGQRLQRSLLLRSDPFVVVAVGTGFGFLEASVYFDVAVDDGLFARSASTGSDVVLRSLASTDAVVVTRQTFATRVEFARCGTGGSAVRAIFYVFALCAVARTGTNARFITFVMTMFTQFRCQFINAQVQVTTLDACGVQLYVSARQTLVRSESPAALR